METIAKNWQALQERIARAAQQAGRDPQEIAVIAVTKTRGAAQIDAAIDAGLTLVGENRVQETEAKKDQVRGRAQWHLIGQLQRNKARKAAALFDDVQSIDSPRLAEALDRHAGQLQRRLDVLVQVNTSGAEQQGGVEPSEVESLVAHIEGLSHLRLQGLMTIGAHTDEEAQIRACFNRLRHLADELKAAGADVRYLPMGMSGDFELAIAEGANMLRLGTVIFGPRPN